MNLFNKNSTYKLVKKAFKEGIVEIDYKQNHGLSEDNRGFLDNERYILKIGDNEICLHICYRDVVVVLFQVGMRSIEKKRFYEGQFNKHEIPESEARKICRFIKKREQKEQEAKEKKRKNEYELAAKEALKSI